LQRFPKRFCANSSTYCAAERAQKRWLELSGKRYYLSEMAEPKQLRPPTTGVKGSVPRFKSAREELPALNREYLIRRNAKLHAQAFMAEVEAAEKSGELISRKRAKLQLGFLLSGLRQRILSFSYALPQRLVGKNQHEIGQILREECNSMLRDLAAWPEKMTDPKWMEKIDADLRPAESVDGLGNLGPIRQELRAEAWVKQHNAKRRAKRKGVESG
jgi:hypothetical protein